MTTGPLAGKRVIVTGAASGIGAAIARRFVHDGARCLLGDLDPVAGEALANELGTDAVFRRVDVTEEADVAAAVDETLTRWGGLDCMVNNAGILGPTGSIAQVSLADWEQTIAVLLRGVFLGIKHAARVMVPQRAGVILNTASTAGVRAGLGPHAYTAAKHGVVGLTASAAGELSQFGIRVNCIAPGAVVSPLTALAVRGDPSALHDTHASLTAAAPSGRAAQPEDLAGVFAQLARDESWYVNGACVVVDGAAEVIAPRLRRNRGVQASAGSSGASTSSN
jgi:NAD(P)-dependent dehydrogenase (short-subunit alcohol dehydrogenase family)